MDSEARIPPPERKPKTDFAAAAAAMRNAPTLKDKTAALQNAGIPPISGGQDVSKSDLPPEVKERLERLRMKIRLQAPAGGMTSPDIEGLIKEAEEKIYAAEERGEETQKLVVGYLKEIASEMGIAKIRQHERFGDKDKKGYDLTVTFDLKISNLSIENVHIQIKTSPRFLKDFFATLKRRNRLTTDEELQDYILRHRLIIITGRLPKDQIIQTFTEQLNVIDTYNRLLLEEQLVQRNLSIPPEDEIEIPEEEIPEEEKKKRREFSTLLKTQLNEHGVDESLVLQIEEKLKREEVGYVDLSRLIFARKTTFKLRRMALEYITTHPEKALAILNRASRKERYDWDMPRVDTKRVADRNMHATSVRMKVQIRGKVQEIVSKTKQAADHRIAVAQAAADVLLTIAIREEAQDADRSELMAMLENFRNPPKPAVSNLYI